MNRLYPVLADIDNTSIMDTRVDERPATSHTTAARPEADVADEVANPEVSKAVMATIRFLTAPFGQFWSASWFLAAAVILVTVRADLITAADFVAAYITTYGKVCVWFIGMCAMWTALEDRFADALHKAVTATMRTVQKFVVTRLATHPRLAHLGASFLMCYEATFIGFVVRQAPFMVALALSLSVNREASAVSIWVEVLHITPLQIGLVISEILQVAATVPVEGKYNGVSLSSASDKLLQWSSYATNLLVLWPVLYHGFWLVSLEGPRDFFFAAVVCLLASAAHAHSLQISSIMSPFGGAAIQVANYFTLEMLCIYTAPTGLTAWKSVAVIAVVLIMLAWGGLLALDMYSCLSAAGCLWTDLWTRAVSNVTSPRPSTAHRESRITSRQLNPMAHLLETVWERVAGVAARTTPDVSPPLPQCQEAMTLLHDILHEYMTGNAVRRAASLNSEAARHEFQGMVNTFLANLPIALSSGEDNLRETLMQPIRESDFVANIIDELKREKDQVMVTFTFHSPGIEDHEMLVRLKDSTGGTVVSLHETNRWSKIEISFAAMIRIADKLRDGTLTGDAFLGWMIHVSAGKNVIDDPTSCVHFSKPVRDVLMKNPWGLLMVMCLRTQPTGAAVLEEARQALQGALKKIQRSDPRPLYNFSRSVNATVDNKSQRQRLTTVGLSLCQLYADPRLHTVDCTTTINLTNLVLQYHLIVTALHLEPSLENDQIPTWLSIASLCLSGGAQFLAVTRMQHVCDANGVALHHTAGIAAVRALGSTQPRQTVQPTRVFGRREDVTIEDITSDSDEPILYERVEGAARQVWSQADSQATPVRRQQQPPRPQLQRARAAPARVAPARAAPARTVHWTEYVPFVQKARGYRPERVRSNREETSWKQWLGF
eukprot:m.465637 g.465637  ORF g.465637 m.465637 type:complete len:889 (-) comp24412_c0_seq1:81-2747(-)